MASSTRLFTSDILKVIFFLATSDFIWSQTSSIRFNSECPTVSCNTSMLFPDSEQYSAVSSSSLYFLTIRINSHFCSNIDLVSLFLKWIPFSVKHSWSACSFIQLVFGLSTGRSPKTEFVLLSILTHLDWIWRHTRYLSVFSPNAGKYGPEETPYLDTFRAVFTLLSYL